MCSEWMGIRWIFRCVCFVSNFFRLSVVVAVADGARWEVATEHNDEAEEALLLTSTPAGGQAQQTYPKMNYFVPKICARIPLLLQR